MRPSIPLRPCISSSHTSSQVKYELSTKRPQLSYEEDALILRVIEAYSIAFQNTARNTIHSGECLFTDYFSIENISLQIIPLISFLTQIYIIFCIFIPICCALDLKEIKLLRKSVYVNLLA